ncbi:MAG: PQQ-binding-like beta-propeller repeat protein [Thermoleophilia bacterium]|nr:PQQ-binding-like beta-propeller repeat protein [Thermoleophilia bacterium]
METRRYDRTSQERRRRARRRLLIVRWSALIACLVIIALAVLIGTRGCGDDASSTGEDPRTTSTAGSSTQSTTGDGIDTTEGGAGSGDVADPEGAGTWITIPVVGPDTTVAPGQGRADEPGDVRVAGTFYGPIQTTFEGITMFRGNASRTYYGQGPIPKNPDVLWKFGPMQGGKSEALAYPIGTGWTGQPCVFERDGKTWVVFGAYDFKIHFLDGATGEELLPAFKGGDIFKGSAVADPDGYPLIFMGCADDKWRIIAFDRDEPAELFHLDSNELPRRLWYGDWDSSVVIRNDYAFLGGENSHFYILKLNRGYDADGKVTVDPQIVLDHPGWTASLLDKLGSKDVSIENSPCLVGDRVYFSNGGGLVQGLDVSATLKELGDGEAPATGQESYPKVFHFWTAGDTDASIVADEEGYLYVCQHSDKRSAAATEHYKEMGQIIKLDPRKTGEGEDPVVWSQKTTKLSGGESGVWATSCLYKDMVYVPTHGGALLGLDRATGEVVWQKTLTEHAWASCVVVDGTLIVGDTYGVLHAWDVSNTRIDPPTVWEFKVPSGGALESTPAVWKGKIFVGCRDGYFYCFGDR